ncbi:Arm DNA-binding domain-containing protein, partial [Clostridium botulinum]
MDYNITYRQKDKGWQFIISYKDNMGKWKQKSKQGFKTKKDAKPAAEKMLKELKNTTKNVPVNNDLIKVTFNQLTTIYLD